MPCPPPGELPDPGIKPRSLALQADSWPPEPSGKPLFIHPICNSLHLLTPTCQSIPTPSGPFHPHVPTYKSVLSVPQIILNFSDCSGEIGTILLLIYSYSRYSFIVMSPTFLKNRRSAPKCRMVNCTWRASPRASGGSNRRLYSEESFLASRFTSRQ